jgi:hypothetical protein
VQHPRGPELTRRQVLGLAAGVGLGAGVGGLGVAAALRDAPRPGTPGDPVSMAMHIHACFSEGQASMHAHLEEAQRRGIDVIWWTEHDFRMQAHGYRQAVRFDGMTEAEGPLGWTWHESRRGDPAEAVAAFVTDPRTLDEPGRALQLRVRGGAPDWSAIVYEGTAWNSTYTTSLVDTALELDVLAQSVGPDAELVVEIASSYRPAAGGRPAGQYVVQYRIGTAGPRRFTERSGLLGVVAVAAGRGWQRLELHPVDDIAALWPDLVAGDSGLFRLRVSVRARHGASAAGVFDRLRFIRSGRADALGLQANLVRRYATRYPGVRQIPSAELSLVRHLNTFGGELSLPDYGAVPPYKDDAVSAAEAMVRRVHAYGGIASHNHPLQGDVADPRALASLLVRTRNLGADAIEVGCRQDLAKVSYAYDVAARNGVFVTATGVTDDHSGLPWDGQRHRWVSSAWAPSTATPDLVRAIGAGRLWFWDLAGWRGSLDLLVQGKPAMGGVLVTGARHVPVDVVATDLPRAGSLDVVIGQVDYAGPAVARPATKVRTVPARDVHNGRCALDLTPGQGQYVRAVVRAGSGEVVGYSNPLWVLAAEPPEGVPAGRRL